MAGFNYVSCIKIAGAPILPPLVTDKEREILAFYKKKAIQKEKELLRRKSQFTMSRSSEFTDQSYETISDGNSDLDLSDNSIETERVMDFIRQALHDVGHTDVELLQAKILEEMQRFRSSSCDTLHLLEDISLSEDKATPDQVTEPSARALSSDQVRHEITDKSRVQDKEEDLTPKASPSSISFQYSAERNTSSSPAKSPQSIYEEIVDDDNDQTPPKLIRRNSYTLDSPSPSVLLYLRSLGRDHSDSSSSEISNGKKVVKNLNNMWEGTEIDTSMKCFQRISPGSNNNAPSKMNRDLIPEIINDNNSNIWPNKIVLDRSIYTDDEESQNALRNVHPTIKTTPEKLKAIIVIQAGIRGYLIRRLMKTNKVMELRNTIKDSLICALALHSEQNVSTADVNLHVRLIRQVTAACYELHAIFFEYTPQEKMHLISVDREKLLSAERAKMNLRRLKGIKSDDESPQNGIRSSVRGKPKRPVSLPLTRRGNSLNRSRR